MESKRRKAQKRSAMYTSMRKKIKEEEYVVQELKKKKEKKMLQIAIMKNLLKNKEWNWEVAICRRGAGARGCYCCGAVQKIVYFGEMGRVALLVNQHDSPEALTLFGC